MKRSALNTVYEALSLEKFLGFLGSHFVHTEGVTGSIPVTPTISTPRFPVLSEQNVLYFAKCSLGLIKPDPLNEPVGRER